ncbi:leucine-rich repeat isoform f [Anaeramoeba ignava]|uniref:Leucine-rich repeat isoform f n=1 Tax=Anaeramoeba ignava TaxID=1746090 RepID=A0A9Q0LDX7_ANAIG|nr:leucine-rich repeat isoform f [Anaeramoeba ignava]
MGDFREVTEQDRTTAQALVENYGVIMTLCWFQIQKTKKKKEDRLFVVSNFHFIVIPGTKNGIKKKILQTAHLYNIKKVESSGEKKLKITFDSFEVELESVEADNIYRLIESKYMKIVQGFPEEKKAKFICQPEGRIVPFQVPAMTSSDAFVNRYEAYCRYHLTNKNQEFIDYVEKELFLSEDLSKKYNFDLTNFKALDKIKADDNQINAIRDALRNDYHFTQFTIFNSDRPDFLKIFSETFTENTTIRKVTISGLETAEGFDELGNALQKNKNIAVEYMDLSVNKIPDKVMMSSLSKGIEEMSSKLTHLDLSFCQLGPKGISSLFNALAKSGGKGKLIYLNLSNNVFSKQGSQAFKKWIESTKENNPIEFLNLANTGLEMKVVTETITEFLSESKLKYLNLADNDVLAKKKDDCVVKMIQTSKTLRLLDLARTKIIGEMAGDIVDAVLGNEKLLQFTLNLTNNDLGIPGAKSITRVLMKNRDSAALQELILDDCKIRTDGLIALCGLDGFLSNKSIERLSLSRNIAKGKDVAKISEPLSQLSEMKNLRYFRMRGNDKFHLAKNIQDLLAKLQKNTNLLALDISGNRCGLDALKELTNMLSQDACNLQLVFFDNNCSTFSNLQEFVWSLKNNTKLFRFQWPKSDIEQMLSSMSKKEAKSTKKKIKELKEKANFYANRNFHSVQTPQISPDYEELEGADSSLIHKSSLKLLNDFQMIPDYVNLKEEENIQKSSLSNLDPSKSIRSAPLPPLPPVPQIESDNDEKEKQSDNDDEKEKEKDKDKEN